MCGATFSTGSSIRVTSAHEAATPEPPLRASDEVVEAWDAAFADLLTPRRPATGEIPEPNRVALPTRAR